LNYDRKNGEQDGESGTVVATDADDLLVAVDDVDGPLLLPTELRVVARWNSALVADRLLRVTTSLLCPSGELMTITVEGASGLTVDLDVEPVFRLTMLLVARRFCRCLTY